MLLSRIDEQTDACRRRSQTGALGRTSKDDLSSFPEDVKRRVGRALWDAQIGLKAPFAKPLKGFGGTGILEVVDDYDGETFRAVYTVRFAGVTSSTRSRRSRSAESQRRSQRST